MPGMRRCYCAAHPGLQRPASADAEARSAFLIVDGQRRLARAGPHSKPTSPPPPRGGLVYYLHPAVPEIAPNHTAQAGWLRASIVAEGNALRPSTNTDAIRAALEGRRLVAPVHMGPGLRMTRSGSSRGS